MASQTRGPMHVARQEARYSMVENQDQPAGGDVLIVEDDQDLRNALGWLFEEERIPIRLAVNGEEALDQVNTALPALILLDLTMPGVPAEEVVRQLRVSERTAQIPIVLLSAAQDVMGRAQELGADGAVAKPYELETLLAAVRQYAHGASW